MQEGRKIEGLGFHTPMLAATKLSTAFSTWKLLLFCTFLGASEGCSKGGCRATSNPGPGFVHCSQAKQALKGISQKVCVAQL